MPIDIGTKVERSGIRDPRRPVDQMHRERLWEGDIPLGPTGDGGEKFVTAPRRLAPQEVFGQGHGLLKTDTAMTEGTHGPGEQRPLRCIVHVDTIRIREQKFDAAESIIRSWLLT